MEAVLVWDGGDLAIPPLMGEPRDDQLQGTVGENLGELAGRECYDSLGTGRSTDSYHLHIKEVNHFSIYEHYNFTVEITAPTAPIVCTLANRPGFWVEEDNHKIRVTSNFRCLLDWEKWKPAVWLRSHDLGDILRMHGHALGSRVVDLPASLHAQGRREQLEGASRLVEPRSDEEKWVSMQLVMSRGCSHELVRHGDRTAISQRSTRFVAETKTDWVIHPLISQYFNEHADLIHHKLFIGDARNIYSHFAKNLRKFLVSKGVDKSKARKQARGAARGYLGNALQTRMIFSASVGQWRRMMEMRMSNYADAEIRVLFNRIFEELQKSRYADRFVFETEPAVDGCGYVLRGN